MLQIVKYQLIGVVPLHQHNGRLANPLDLWSKRIKEVSGKRVKTDADHEELFRLEWYGSLYLEDGKPCIPGPCVDATLINAAKKSKKGAQAKAGMLCEANFPITHDGDEDMEKLWLDERFRFQALMRVGTAKVVRTMPSFFPWSVIIAVSYNDSLLNAADIDRFVKIGGEQIGILEGRPRFGRYNAQKL